MADPPNARSGTDANCRTGISPNMDVGADSQVRCNALHPQCLAGAFDYAIEFRLAGAESGCLLGSAPMLNQMGSMEQSASGCASARL